ncbi:MAG: 3-deoxy-7-phosphoheptulonate synthase [Erysipelotrichaceae bacterium]|nr:3-deoxy-7-phosphoheptulonate synthase [Erysipelotrichaceae bacterium]
MNMNFSRKLPTPQEIKDMYPLSEKGKQIKLKNDEQIQKVFKNESDKFILVIGPCSADREEAVIDYINRLKVIQQQVKDEIIIIPRIYTNKPRTTGQGYKGMLHQPDPNEKPDMLKGLIAIRKLHMRAIEETGFSCADEMLYSENHRYLSDLLSYVAVGARSVEDQQHRLTASGLDIPVGMKNPTSGDISVMLNSIKAAQTGHTFIYRGWEVISSGNPYAHAILRGYVNKHGESSPNYHYEDLMSLASIYDETHFINPAIIVDTNHSNSNKQYEEQIRIANEVLHSMQYNEKIRRIVKGLMIESYIEDGCQKVDGGVYGKSITDPCLGWQKTEQLILNIAAKIKKMNNK